MSLFGADPAIVGRDIILNGDPYTVIGVMPGNSEFNRRSADLWVPLAFPPSPARDYHYLSAVARLKPGVSLEQAQAEMSAIAGRIATLYPDIKKGWGATVDRYLDRVVGPQLQLQLRVLMGAVVAVLLIACSNLANMLLARATLRSREIALRLALGAHRRRLVRMLLTESLLLAGFGGLLGVAFGYGLLRWIQSLLPPFYFPAESNISMDGRVLLFLAAVTLLTSLGFGLAPALHASRRDAGEALKEGGRSNTGGRWDVGTRHAFVALQVAAAFILLAGAGLLLRSFQRVIDVDTGYDTEGIVAAYLPLPMERNPEPIALTQYIQQILDEVRAVPGVQHAAIASAIPLRGWGDGMPFRMPEKPDEIVGTGFKIITPDYFRTLGLRVVSGRLFDSRDTAGSVPVVVVNESFVRRYSPNANPLGRRILVERILPTRRGLGPLTAWEIIGVVADEKATGLENLTDVGAYASFAQNPVVGLGLVARGIGEPAMLIKAIQRAATNVNKFQVLDRPMTVAQLKADSMVGRRLPTYLLGGFALLAMLLACAGIYGVLSFVTAKRTQEIGIRAALGASQADLVRMVLRTGTVPVVIGLAIGLAGALWLSKFIQSLLFQVSPIDPISLSAVAVIFLGVAFLACFVPAWRASRIDPMMALRQE
jgi:putative ABC transport system permease protein